MKNSAYCFLIGIVFTLSGAFAIPVPAQPDAAVDETMPVVIKVDDVSVMPLFKPDGKPLLVNFWATWCVPCVEEFPLLVELHNEYKDRIDIITISLDDLAEINRDVPKFLKEQKATMPAYLLYTKDENTVISKVSKNLTGGLPFTVLFGTDGNELYAKQGLIDREVIKPELDASLVIKECKPPFEY